MQMSELVLNGRAVDSADVDNDVTIAYVQGSPRTFTGVGGVRHFILGLLAHFSATVSLVKTVALRSGLSGSIKFNGVAVNAEGFDIINATVLSRGGNFNVQSTAFQYLSSHAVKLKAAVAAGTALAAGTIPADKWGIYLYSIDSAGTITSTPGTANFTTGYATEALAILALPATPASQTTMGFVTVKTAVGLAFVGGTDALTGGAGGNPASTTNYTPMTSPFTAIAGATYRFLFTNGPLNLSFPCPLHADYGNAVIAQLDASGTGGTKGTISPFVASL